MKTTTCHLCGKPVPVVVKGGNPKVTHMACLMAATKHLRTPTSKGK